MNEKKNNIDPIWKQARTLRGDPTQLESYNPDWVLRHLLEIHSQFFAPRDIKRVLADSIPHDQTRLKEDRVDSYDWYWILELLPGHSPEKEKPFVYLLGWFDPQLQEPRTLLSAWFFPTLEEALSPAIDGLEEGKLNRKPDKKLYEFLKSQIDQGIKSKRIPENYWKFVSDPNPGD